MRQPVKWIQTIVKTTKPVLKRAAANLLAWTRMVQKNAVHLQMEK
jgi:hypothetical protein